MKIALVSTPFFTVPPKNYGGLEVIVANLGKELAKRHSVTIFAPKGSHVEGCRIIEVGEPSLTVFARWQKAEQEMFESVKEMLDDFDVIHTHDWFGSAYSLKIQKPNLHILHTHHGGITNWYTKLPFKLNMCAISNYMKSIYEKLGIPTRTVYNGVDLTKYPLKKNKGDRFLWLSRITFFKAPHKAIELAKKTGINLDVAGATQFVEDAKYVELIKKNCDGNQIRFLGEVTNEQKVELMQNAAGLLVTAKWGEPFGLHIVEAMATGTPVIAISDGGIAETVKKGGILCTDLDDMEAATHNIRMITPETCRRNAEVFSAEKMAYAYEAAYMDVLKGLDW